jgi:FkbM family methyltransferase
LQFIYKLIYNQYINPVLLWVNQLLSIFTTFRLPPSGVIHLKIDSVRKIKMATNQTSYVTKLLYWNGVDSFEYTLVFKKLIMNCHVFIDIGANSGYYSLLACGLNEKISVHSFEPATGPHFFLKKNVAINGFKNQIDVQAIALSEERNEVLFYEVTNHKYSYLKYNLGGVGSLESDMAKTARRVETISLDQFVEDNEIKNIDLIKLDTEGTEHFILKGSMKSLRKFQPIIICELLFHKIEHELEDIFRKENYLFFLHSKGVLIPTSTLIRAEDDGVRDCFFVPKSKIELLEKFIHQAR